MADIKPGAIKTPASIVIFGGMGDLAWRKLIPAFYNLYTHGFMPQNFVIYGVHYKDIKESEYEKRMLEGINQFSRCGKVKKEQWNDFKSKLCLFSGDFTFDDTYTRLKTKLEANDTSWDTRATRLFYYSVSPNFIDDISTFLAKHQLANNILKDRIVVEKPFGTDLSTAKELNKLLVKQFNEKQIYRIDHYLGKEVVQNIMVFRFANYIFEPLWNKDFIDHIQISVTEEVSVGSRGNYYEGSGAMRDMIQNHLLQLLSLIAMDCPEKYQSELIRDAKVKVLKQIRPFTEETIKTDVVRGQYTSGEVKGEKQVAYTHEANVKEDSSTETFVAAKFFVDNKRWQGVPFYLRTGKCLERKATVIVIQFKDSPNKIFRKDVDSNRLIISIQPEQSISLLFESKVPGVKLNMQSVEMDFNYPDSDVASAPEAYETLLLDILEGDGTLFMRADHVEAACKVVMPILDAWSKSGTSLKKYPAGSWGPEAANVLIKPSSKKWILSPKYNH